MGKGVTSIGDSAFSSCLFIVEIYNQSNVEITLTSHGNLADDVRIYTSGESNITEDVNGNVFYEYKGEYKLVAYHGEKKELTLPESFNGNSYSIRQYVFSGYSGLTGELVIPNSVISIGNYAFRNCSGFTGELVIPNSVTSIGVNAFDSCNGFTGKLEIPKA